VKAWLLATLALSGCIASADIGPIQQPTLTPRVASGTAHLAIGGGGTRQSEVIVGLGLDTRVDVAGGSNSRWAAGASAIGGVKIVPQFFLTGRIGIWKAIVSAAPEATVVPSFELGGYIPLDEKYDPKHPQFGASSTGIIAGVREDLDDRRYFTVFVGYALFILPGY
jgi:hypothetical protein